MNTSESSTMSESPEPPRCSPVGATQKGADFRRELSGRVLRVYAISLFRTNSTWIRLKLWGARHPKWIGAATCLGILGLQSTVLLFAHRLDPFLSTKSAFEGVKSTCLGVGAALIGATAIASSFILFALQVNVERMPAGLFRRLSADFRLLCAFGLAFALSAAVAFLSLANDDAQVSLIALGAAEACVLTPILYLYAYRRALRLINPVEQLRLVVEHATKDLRAWERRADLGEQFFGEPQPNPHAAGGGIANLRRSAFFRANAHWDAETRTAISHVTAYSRFYAERGDHEVSYAALRAMAAINGTYIKAKGNTFFNNELLLDNPLASDGVINATLEALRQSMKISLTRGDEQQATQTLETLEFLVKLYLTIQYPGHASSRTHALLAAGYLSSAVESVVPAGMVDVLMAGMRCHGRAAIACIGAGTPDNAIGLIDKLGQIGAATSVIERMRPISLEAVEQLAEVTISLLLVRSGTPSTTFRHVTDSLKLIADFLLKSPDTPIISTHASTLAPYFSYQSTNFKIRLLDLVNRLGEDGVDPDTLKQITENLFEWSRRPQEDYRELLLLSIDKRSGFTFDILHWTKDLIEILIAASNLDGVKDRVSKGLRKNALHLTWMFGWIPRDHATATYTEGNKLSGILFEVAWKARRRGADDCYEAARDILMKWAVEAGAHETAWAILERSLINLAALTLGIDDQEAWLLEKLTEAMTAPGAPSAELRFRAARGLREEADELSDTTYALELVDLVLGRHPHGTKRSYLRRIAEILAPAADDPEDGRSGIEWES